MIETKDKITSTFEDYSGLTKESIFLILVNGLSKQRGWLVGISFFSVIIGIFGIFLGAYCIKGQEGVALIDISKYFLLIGFTSFIFYIICKTDKTKKQEQKEHYNYVRILIETLNGLFAPFSLGFGFDFDKNTEEETKNYLIDLGFNETSTKTLLGLKNENMSEFKKRISLKEISNKLNEMKENNKELINYWRSNSFYFDESVSKIIEEIIGLNQNLINLYYFFYEKNEDKTDTINEIDKEHQKLKTKTENLEKIMRKSLGL